MTKSKPIRITTNQGTKTSFKAVAWLLGIEAKWSMAANPFYVDDLDLAAKVTPQQLQLLKAKYSYLSHVEAHTPEPIAQPEPKREAAKTATTKTADKIAFDKLTSKKAK